MTDEQLAEWFIWHPPNDETKPKYEALQKARAPMVAFANALMLRQQGGSPPLPTMQEVRDACRDLAVEIRRICPPCGDTEHAINRARAAAFAINTALAAIENREGSDVVGLLLLHNDFAMTECTWFSNSAVACGGV